MRALSSTKSHHRGMASVTGRVDLGGSYVEWSQLDRGRQKNLISLIGKVLKIYKGTNLKHKKIAENSNTKNQSRKVTIKGRDKLRGPKTYRQESVMIIPPFTITALPCPTACITQWSDEPRRAGPPKKDRPYQRVLTKRFAGVNGKPIPADLPWEAHELLLRKLVVATEPSRATETI